MQIQDASNSDKDNNLETGELLFEINMKLFNMRFEKIEIWEGVSQS